VLLAWPDITINSLIWQWLRNPSNHQLTNKTQVSINKPPFFCRIELDRKVVLPIDSSAMSDNIRQVALVVVVVGNDAVGACR
jgi:hypothetical protein